MTLTKVSNGGVGSFTFIGANGWLSQTITTTTSGVGVSGATQTLTTAGTETIITETIPATDINCTGPGAGGIATPDWTAGSVILDVVQGG